MTVIKADLPQAIEYQIDETSSKLSPHILRYNGTVTKGRDLDHAMAQLRRRLEDEMGARYGI